LLITSVNAYYQTWLRSQEFSVLCVNEKSYFSSLGLCQNFP